MAKNIMLLKKKRSLKAKELTQLRAKAKKLRADEEALQAQLEAVEDEIPADLEQQIEKLTDQQTELNDQIGELVDELAELDETLADVNAELDAPAEDDGEEEPAARNRRSAVASRNFACRSRCFASRSALDAFYASSEMRTFLENVRTMLPAAAARKGKTARRSVNGAELAIPEIMLEVLRDNLQQYSKLISKVRLRNVSGNARQNIIGKIPEGIWMEMAGALNELEFSITDIETDGYKVGGFIVLENYLLKDSDIALGEEIMYMLAQSIGLAVDKAIVFGLGAASHMPLGIVSRLAQTEEPSNWGRNRMPWTDLHTANVLQLDLADKTGTAFFRTLLTALSKAKPTYSTEGKLWIMNELTKQDVIIRSLEYNANAAIVSGMDDTMPIIGGEIVTLEFMPDYMIVGGYLSEFLLVEREGGSFGSSDIPFFVEDKTVWKATARYDGQPIEGEAFVAVSYNNTPVTTSIDFAVDYVNSDPNVLIVTSAAGTASGTTVLTVTGRISNDNALYAVIGAPASIAMGDKPSSHWTKFVSGTDAIKAATGTGATVVETDADGRVVSIGYLASVTARA